MITLYDFKAILEYVEEKTGLQPDIYEVKHFSHRDRKRRLKFYFVVKMRVLTAQTIVLLLKAKLIDKDTSIRCDFHLANPTIDIWIDNEILDEYYRNKPIKRDS